MAGSVVLVEALRGDTVESRHRGAVAVVDASGGLVWSVGDVEALVFPRSSVKPLQALPLVETGAADAFGAGARELALATASHGGEPAHVEAVQRFLAAAGLGGDALACGTHRPLFLDAAVALDRAGEAPSALHHQCSGKHAGFLCTAVHCGEDPRGYIEADHPAQRRVTAALAAMTGHDLRAAPCGCDGCGIPAFALPLRAIARGMARMADTAGLGPERARACGRLLDAMAAEPFFVDGTGGAATEIMSAAPGTVRLKPGAEGVYVAALPALGLGLALKIEDGAKRAAELAVATILDRLGCFDDAARHRLAALLHPELRNMAGRVVGALRPTDALRRP